MQTRSGKTTERKEFVKPRKQVTQKMSDILQNRYVNEDNTSTAEISESQEKLIYPDEQPNPEVITKLLQSEIIQKVQKKAKRLEEDTKFFQMQDELLKKAEKKTNLSPQKPNVRLSKVCDQSPAFSTDDLCSQVNFDATQHQLRNRSVAKRDIKQEQKQHRLEKKQIKEKSKTSVFNFVLYFLIAVLMALVTYHITMNIKPEVLQQMMSRPQVQQVDSQQSDL